MQPNKRPNTALGLLHRLIYGSNAIKETEKTKKPKGGSLDRLAAQWCKNEQFQNWVREIYDRCMGGNGAGYGDISIREMTQEQFARHAILVLCEVDSRAELDHSEKGAALFQSLIRTPFMAFCNENNL